MNGLTSLVVLALATAATAAQCPTNFINVDDECFYVLDSPGVDITWEDARSMCGALNEPGWKMDLASLDTTEQLEKFAEIWATTLSANYPSYGYMWIGFTRESGEWANLDGVPISLYSNMWREGHPHDMNMYTYIEDVFLTSGIDSRGRFYASCTMNDALQRALCRAYHVMPDAE